MWLIPSWLFGLVWVFFPAHVTRFYKWFHPNSASVQKVEPKHARNAGIFWLIFTAIIQYATWGQ